jgi:hypothetical protein
MEFLKRYYEKIVLIVVLLGLIGSTGYLIWQTMGLAGGTDESLGRISSKDATLPIDTAMYDKTIKQMASPVLWESDPNQMFRTEKPKPPDPGGGGPTSGPPPVLKCDPAPPPVYFRDVGYEPFNLMFMTYSYDDKKNLAYNFQLNFDKRGITYFIANVGDTIKQRLGEDNTGYVIVGFERIITNVVGPVGPVGLDLSTLTVQAPGEEPLKLQVKEAAKTREPYAWAGCQWCNTNTLTVVSGQPKFVRRGSTVLCGTNTYNVIDIKTNQMIIVEPSKAETNVLSRTGSSRGK